VTLSLCCRRTWDWFLTWDTAVAEDPRGFVVIRLPASEYGDAFKALVPVFVGVNAEDVGTAASLVDFLSNSVHAKDTYLAHGYMVDDGADAAEYDRRAAPRFQKVYGNISRQIVDDYGVTNGLAVDIGCGPGQLVLELARTTDLHTIGVDIEPECIAIARRHAKEAGLEGRADFICADAHSLPLPDSYADLVVSRGTLPFLRDQALAIREVYRVLKPGGIAFLGGGMGRYTLEEEARKLYPQGVSPEAALDWGRGQTREDSIFPFPVRSFEALMTKAGVAEYTVTNEGGRWVAFRK
jgi:ubiquinone/menaquinone biosynthesis C-methylase UbiE